jgi:hypothetical protein
MSLIKQGVKAAVSDRQIKDAAIKSAEEFAEEILPEAGMPDAASLAATMGKGAGKVGFASMLKDYSMASMAGGMVGDMLGYDAASAGMAGGLGYLAAQTLLPALGPVGWAAAGLLSIFGFAKKKPKPKNDPQRSIYGMPEFEWESYLYNLYTQQGYEELAGVTGSTRSLSSAGLSVENRSVGNVNININGGDTAQVERTVRKVLRGELGGVAATTLTTARSI